MNIPTNKRFSWAHALAHVTAFIFVLAGVLFFLGYEYPSEEYDLNEPPIQRILDDSLYTQDFLVKESTLFTPHTYYHYVIAALAATGLGVSKAFFVFYILSLAIVIGGVCFISRSKELSVGSSGFILFWIFYVLESGSIGLVEASSPVPIPVLLAAGFVLWGIAFAFKRQWVLTYLFFGIAALMSFLVGFIAGLVIIPLFLFDEVRKHHLGQAVVAIVLWMIGLGLVYIPMYLSGAADASLLSDQAFARVYGLVNRGEYLFLSEWTFSQWVWLACFYLGGILCLKRTPEMPQLFVRNIELVVLITFVLLFISFSFAQLDPSAFIAKLHWSRVAIFSEFAIILGLAWVFQNALRQRQWVLVWVLLVLPVSSNTALFLLLLSLSLPLVRQYRLERFSFGVVTWGLFLACALIALPLQLRDAIGGIFPLFVLAVLMTPVLVKNLFLSSWARFTLMSVLAAAMVFLCSIAVLSKIPDSLQSIYKHRLSVTDAAQDDLSIIAIQFRENSPKDALILIPPSKEFQSFRRLSKRSVVLDSLGAPYSGAGLVEWKNRMEAVLGELPTPDSDMNALYAKRSWANVVDVAKQYGAGYILTQESWHGGDLSGEPYLAVGPWDIYRVEDLMRSRSVVD